MWLYLHYVYPLVHAGAVSVGGVVGAISSVLTANIVVITIAVALVIARKRKAKECGTCDLKATVSVDKYSMRILVYCTVNFYAVWCWFIVIHIYINWYNFVEKIDEWLSYS